LSSLSAQRPWGKNDRLKEKKMSKKYLSLMLIVALSHMMLLMAPTSVYGQAEKEQRLTAKAKADVAAFGIGPEARVSVKLRAGKKLKGYITQAGEDGFVITDSKNGSTTSIAYADVAEVQRQKGLSTGKAILIGVGATFGALFLIGIITYGVNR
jgi:hypothetical protein